MPSDRTEFIVEENNIILECVGIGYPPPLVQWRKLNRSLSDRVSITNISMSTNLLMLLHKHLTMQ